MEKNEASVYSNNFLRNPDYKGFKRALVVGNVDASDQGQIKVYIPEIMATSPVQMEDEFGDPVDGSARIENYVLAYPTFDYCDSGESNRGEFKIPKLGTWLYVFFESEDPRKCNYTRMSVNIDNKITLKAPLSSSQTDFENPVSRVNMDLIRNDEDGFIIERNTNPQTNSFVIKFPNGYKFLIHDNQTTQRVRLITSSGHTLELVDKSGDWTKDEGALDDNTQVGDSFIRLVTNKGNSIVLDDTVDDMRVHINKQILVVAGDNIDITGGANMKVAIAKDITINAGKDINVTAGGNINFTAGGKFNVAAASYNFK